MKICLYFMLFVGSCYFLTFPTEAKTVKGTFTSFIARAEKGQYLSSFCFHGRYSLVTKRLNRPPNPFCQNCGRVQVEAYADEILKVSLNFKFDVEREENIVGK